jgi:ankyrin repeat protein
MRELEKLVDAARRGALDEVTALVAHHKELINRKDAEGATPLHYAALGGHRPIVEFLVRQGAEINATDTQFGATPAGWAIEYLRQMGGFLGIELSDFAFAIEKGHVEWVSRFLKRFPALRQASDTQGRPFRQLAEQSGSIQIVELFESDSAI